MIYGAQLQNQMIHHTLQSLPDVLPTDDGDDVRQVIRDTVNSVEQLAGFLEEAIETTRGLTVDLSPPVLQDDGLMEALQWLRSHMEEMHNLSVELSGEGLDEPLPPDLRMMLFHVVRELLFNVVKHADTEEVRVRLHPIVPDPDADAAPGVHIEVEDDGDGFDVEAVLGDKPSGFGLPDVKRRIEFVGGTLEIDSTPGHGTRCMIELPPEAIQQNTREDEGARRRGLA